VNRVGRYEITEPLGQGGMGTVYKAYDPLLARVVAVKVISAQFSTQPDLRERFFREARAVARLDHPNIVTVYDLGEEDGVPYLAMQFLEGRDLEHRMRSPEGMSLTRKVEIAIAIAGGLEHAHTAGIVHRDVKPANVFITNEGQIKLLDFGLARLVTSELTRSNVMVGTVNYMAPEQLRGEKTDHRVDIFSFGVVMYEMLSGRKPFQAESFASTMYKILEETPEPLGQLDPTLPPLLVAVVDRAIAKAREDRYQLMAELHRDLEASYDLVHGLDTAGSPRSNASARASSQVKPRRGARSDAPHARAADAERGRARADTRADRGACRTKLADTSPGRGRACRCGPRRALRASGGLASCRDCERARSCGACRVCARSHTRRTAGARASASARAGSSGR
jgi:serine/threonine-protein kinase